MSKIATTVLLLILLLSATVLAWLTDKGRKDAEIQRAEAQRQTEIASHRLRVAISKQLAMRAIRNWDDDLGLALLLAVQGARIDDNPETKDSLQDLKFSDLEEFSGWNTLLSTWNVSLHQICTKFPPILLIIVITVAQTDVMLGPRGTRQCISDLIPTLRAWNFSGNHLN